VDMMVAAWRIQLRLWRRLVSHLMVKLGKWYLIEIFNRVAIVAFLNPTASNGVFLVDCSSIGDLPDIVFTIARRKFPLKSGDYVLRYGNTCVSGFTSMNGNSLLILGEIFLGAYYTTYDIVYKLIGLAPAIH